MQRQHHPKVKKLQNCDMGQAPPQKRLNALLRLPLWIAAVFENYRKAMSNFAASGGPYSMGVEL